MPPIMAAAPAIKRPRLRVLNDRQIGFVLERNSVARIAFQRDGRIELMPVHYVMLDGAVIGRISLGRKYLSWLVANEVVVEVEETTGLFDWRSVVIRGSVSLLRSHGGTDVQREQFHRAVTAIRALIPGAFTESDPTPDRRFVFRVDPTEITGREASTK